MSTPTPPLPSMKPSAKPLQLDGGHGLTWSNMEAPLLLPRPRLNLSLSGGILASFLPIVLPKTISNERPILVSAQTSVRFVCWLQHLKNFASVMRQQVRVIWRENEAGRPH